MANKKFHLCVSLYYTSNILIKKNINKAPCGIITWIILVYKKYGREFQISNKKHSILLQILKIMPHICW